MTTTLEIAAITADQGASYWLKNRLAELSQRDCLDMMRDCETLADMARKRFSELTGCPLAELEQRR